MQTTTPPVFSMNPKEVQEAKIVGADKAILGEQFKATLFTTMRGGGGIAVRAPEYLGGLENDELQFLHRAFQGGYNIFLVQATTDAPGGTVWLEAPIL